MPFSAFPHDVNVQDRGRTVVRQLDRLWCPVCLQTWNGQARLHNGFLLFACGNRLPASKRGSQGAPRTCRAKLLAVYRADHSTDVAVLSELEYTRLLGDRRPAQLVWAELVPLERRAA